MCTAYGGTDGTLYAAGGLKAPLLLPDHAHDVIGQSLLNLHVGTGARTLGRDFGPGGVVFKTPRACEQQFVR